MNLLASSTVSINDLVKIITMGKDEKDTKKITEMAKNADSDGMGFIDNVEFGHFIKDLSELRLD